MKASNMEAIGNSLIRMAYLKFDAEISMKDCKDEVRKARLLESLSECDIEWLTTRIEQQLVHQQLGSKYMSSSCWNCKTSEYCAEMTVEKDLEPWKAFLCNGYEPDFNGLDKEIHRLKEISSILNGLGLPTKYDVIRQSIAQATKKWFDELKLIGKHHQSSINDSSVFNETKGKPLQTQAQKDLIR
jgi:hypothetical protein